MRVLLLALLLAGCCDKEGEVEAWNQYHAQEQAISKEMNDLVPFPSVLPFVYWEEPEARYVVPYGMPIRYSWYRVVRDERERRLLQEKRRYNRQQLRIRLDECNCVVPFQ